MFCKSRGIGSSGLLFYIILMIMIDHSYCEEAKTLKFATGEYAPYVSKEMVDYGMVAEIISATVKEMGFKPEYLFYSWKRCEASVKRARVWATFPYAYTEERAKHFLYSDELIVATNKFFYYKKRFEKKIIWNKLEDLMSFKMGGVLGYFYEKEFNQVGLDMYYSDTEKTALKVLKFGRIDLLPLDEAIGWSLIRKDYPQEIDDFGVLEKAYITTGNYLMVSKNYPDSQKLLNKFNIAFRKIKHEGVIDQILKKYKIGSN